MTWRKIVYESIHSNLQDTSENNFVNFPHPQKIQTDSRHLKNGDWFLPLIGENFDGHNFIHDAIKQGAAGFFYEIGKKIEIEKNLLRDIPSFAIDHGLNFLCSLARGWRKYLTHTKTIAITGSSGKTTVKEILLSILRETKLNVIGSEKSFNNEIGVAKTILSANEKTDFLVLECGARKTGDIKILVEIALPNLVTLLNVGTAHLGIFGSRENLMDTKLEIFRYAPKDSFKIVCGDDPLLLQKAKSLADKNLFTFGYESQNDLIVSPQDFSFSYHQQKVHFKTNEIHEAFPLNAGAATLMAFQLKISEKNILDGIEKYQPAPGRFEKIKTKHGWLIDDSYNANPSSMSMSLKTLAKNFSDKKILIILGDMLELGDESEKYHFEIGQLIQQLFKNQKITLITIGELSRSINTGASQKLSHQFNHVDAYLNHPIHEHEQFDVIFLKASHGMKLNKISQLIQSQKRGE